MALSLTSSWKSATSGTWGTATNWSSANPGGNVWSVINQTGTAAYTVTIAGLGTVAFGGLDLNSGNATVVISGTRVFNGLTLDLESGTLNVGTASLKLDTQIINSGSTFTADGGGTLDVKGGLLSVSSGTVTAVTANLIGGSSTIGTGFLNAGTLNIGDSTHGGTFLTLNGGTIDAGNTSGIINIGSSAVFAANGGRIEAASISGTGTIAIGGTTTLEIDSTSVSGVAVTLGSSSVLDFGSAAALLGFTGTVYGLIDGSNISTAANGITVNGVTGFTASYNAGVITLHGGSVNGKTITLGTSDYTANTQAEVVTIGSNTEIFLYDSAVCFAEGTRILTDRGEIAVEALAENDVVLTADQDALPVRWIGQRHLDLTTHPRAETAAPIRISRGAFAQNQPHRDLVVSPDHCLFVDGKLIPAKLLINGMTIVQERATKAVTYYHVELDRHAVLLAEGLPAESYLDTGNRAFFSNAGLALILHPEFHVNAGLNCWEQDACAPLAVSKAAVRPVWEALAARAQTMGFVQPEILTTDEADLRLVAGGRTFRPVSSNANRFVFVLPQGTTAARIASRADAPAESTPWLDDGRQLGVAVGRIVVRGNADYVEMPVDHPALSAGWHAVETEGPAMWRWTNGNAALPIEAIDGPVTVELHVRQLGTYIVAKTETAQRLAA